MNLLFVRAVAALLLAPLAGPVLAQTTPPPVPKAISAHFIIVQGRVRAAATGQGLPGVTVLLKGTAKSVSTDASGHYTLANVPAQHAVLVLSGAGYITQEQAVYAPQMPDAKLVAETGAQSKAAGAGGRR